MFSSMIRKSEFRSFERQSKTKLVGMLEKFEYTQLADFKETFC